MAEYRHNKQQERQARRAEEQEELDVLQRQQDADDVSLSASSPSCLRTRCMQRCLYCSYVTELHAAGYKAGVKFWDTFTYIHWMIIDLNTIRPWKPLPVASLLPALNKLASVYCLFLSKRLFAATGQKVQPAVKTGLSLT